MFYCFSCEMMCFVLYQQRHYNDIILYLNLSLSLEKPPDQTEHMYVPNPVSYIHLCWLDELQCIPSTTSDVVCQGFPLDFLDLAFESNIEHRCDVILLHFVSHRSKACDTFSLQTTLIRLSCRLLGPLSLSFAISDSLE